MLFSTIFNKKIVGVATLTSMFALYCYNEHMYKKELFSQMNYLLQNKVELSGVYLQQRQPFGFLWYIQWLLPYHQSLKIIHKDGTVRHVGLGKHKNNNDFLNMESEFILHKGGNYETLNNYETSIPIECWVEYKWKFGKFPENINVAKLNEITMTREETTNETELYKVQFGKPSRDLNNDFVITSCRSAVTYAIRTEELSRTKEIE